MNERTKLDVKNTEIKIIVELMKNSRRSDRELAKSVGVSQPTVSKAIKRLEKEGLIKEYTMIPDFKRLGYQLMGVSFVKTRVEANEKEAEGLRKAVVEVEEKNPHASLMAVNGDGMGKDKMFITFYKNFSAYSEAMHLTRLLPFIKAENIQSFLVDLNDKDNYRLLTLREIAHHIQSHSANLKSEV